MFTTRERRNDVKKHARSLVKVIENEYGREAELFGVEVGVWKGELSRDLLAHFPRLHLTMIDLWTAEGSDKSMHGKDSSQEAMENALFATHSNTEFALHRRIVERGDSVEVADCCKDRFFDFVFIDADHFYESVRKDLLAWFTKIKQGGIISGHDYDGQGDRKKGWGVKRAVDEFFGTLKLDVNVEPGLVWWVKKW